MKKIIFYLYFAVFSLLIACNDEATLPEKKAQETVATPQKKIEFLPSTRWRAYELPNNDLLILEQNLHNPSPIALLNLEGQWYESTYQYNKYKGYAAYKIDYQIGKSLVFADWDGTLHLTDARASKENAQKCNPIENQTIVHIKGTLTKKKNQLILTDCQAQGKFHFIENRNLQFLIQAYDQLKELEKNSILIEMEAYIDQGKIGILHMGALRNEGC